MANLSRPITSYMFPTEDVERVVLLHIAIEMNIQTFIDEEKIFRECVNRFTQIENGI